MRISTAKKFVFLSNPRCGSTSLRRMLDPYADIRSGLMMPFHHHVNAPRLVKAFDALGWRWDEFTSITTIRNPWDRMISCWLYAEKNPGSVWAARRKTLGDDFERFCEPDGLSAMPVSVFSGDGLVSHIVPIEKAGEQLPPIFASLEIPWPGMKHVNRTAGGDRASYYTDRARDLIAKHFASDIEIGGYSFDEPFDEAFEEALRREDAFLGQ